jgi:hypothetical protein
MRHLNSIRHLYSVRHLNSIRYLNSTRNVYIIRYLDSIKIDLNAPESNPYDYNRIPIVSKGFHIHKTNHVSHWCSQEGTFLGEKSIRMSWLVLFLTISSSLLFSSWWAASNSNTIDVYTLWLALLFCWKSFMTLYFGSHGNVSFQGNSNSSFKFHKIWTAKSYRIKENSYGYLFWKWGSQWGDHIDSKEMIVQLKDELDP